MNVLALDTATPATTVALARSGAAPTEARDDPPSGARPQHAQRLLVLAQQLLDESGLRWAQLDTIAVGVGPGGYTGLRIGLAAAHGLALACGAGLVGVSSLRTLAEPVRGRAAAAVLDARRGEAFVAVYRDGEQLLAPRVCAPEDLAGWVGHGGPDVLAVGDGALRFGVHLAAEGVTVAPAGSALHRISAAAACRLAADGLVSAPVPEYLRLADAERAQRASTT